MFQCLEKCNKRNIETLKNVIFTFRKKEKRNNYYERCFIRTCNVILKIKSKKHATNANNWNQEHLVKIILNIGQMTVTMKNNLK